MLPVGAVVSWLRRILILARAERSLLQAFDTLHPMQKALVIRFAQRLAAENRADHAERAGRG